MSKVAYTIAQLDAAIEAINGSPIRRWPGWSRTIEIERAAAR